VLRAVVTILKNKYAMNVRFCTFIGNMLYNVAAKVE
jgi:hypothetical protein